MRSATFLLSKHPYAQHSGDTRVSRLLIELVSELIPVSCVALWSGSPVASPVEIRCVAKPPPRVARLLIRSIAGNRSLVHTRYLTPALVNAVAEDRAEAIVAEHTYMAEAAIAAGRSGPNLFINTHVLESSVLNNRAALSPHLAPLRLEAARTRRDEVRCAEAAAVTACLGDADLIALREAGARRLRRLDLVLPPLPRADDRDRPRALFIGDRGWAPNARAAREVAALWPRISARVPGAELVVAGHPKPRERAPRVPGVRWLGFVDDVDELYSSATVLLAPVATGGGVRVKILEAAARGLPVVATEAGLGSISSYLPIEPVASSAELVEMAARLLRDRRLARAAGADLFEANRQLWDSGLVQRGIEAWLGPVGDAADLAAASPPQPS